MNRTFGFLAIGLLAVSLLASCKKENGSGNNDPKDGFVALMEQTDKAGNNDRTHINPPIWDEGQTPNVLWTANDLIKVRNAEGTTLPYQLTEGANKTSGNFYTGAPHDGFLESSSFNAIYPASNQDGVENTISGISGISGNTATFTLPATQTYKANSFAEGSIPMVAHSTNQTLSFRNVLGCICFPLTGTCTVTKIVLTSKDPDEKLWGVFTADCTSDAPIPSYTSGGDNSITLDCSANGGVSLSNTPTHFCIAVPPETLTSGFTMEVYNGDSKIYWQRTKSTMPTDFIKRSRIRLIKQMDISIGFSVEAGGRRVLFAPGNLQWSANETHYVATGGTADGTWRFAEHQWDIIGSGNANISPTYTGWIDLFGWATSGWHDTNDPYNLHYQPWSHTTISDVVNTDYNWYGYGPSTNMTYPNLVGTSLYYDWGQYNDIDNPSTGKTDRYGTWRLLTGDEWKYVIETRSTASGIRYAKAIVHEVPGLLLVPDNWNETYTLNNYNEPRASFNSNVISDWGPLENAGCVFLPAGGYSYENGVDQVNEYGYYWSSTHIDPRVAWRYLLSNTETSQSYDGVGNYMGNRYRGESIRLAKDI